MSSCTHIATHRDLGQLEDIVEAKLKTQAQLLQVEGNHGAMCKNMPPVCGYMGYVIPISPFKVFGDPAGPFPWGPF